MTKRFNRLCAAVLLVLPTSTLTYAADVDFARDVLPVLSNTCFACHGPDAKEKELRLDSHAAATFDLGGYKAIDPANPEKSEIIARLFDADDPMPPEDAEQKISPEHRELLKKWVMQGGKYAQHWAFVPPQKATPPVAVKKGFLAKKKRVESNAIDAFVLRQLSQKGVDFAPEADRPTLARRAALTLTGLPPMPEEVSEFMADRKADAYDRFVDRMLAKTAYGEHQARYWLDAVRYGDTHGLHLDNKRGIYPYRDWVVRAFNKNLPLNDFITWQVAGDLLPHPTLEQYTATGYVRMNPSTAEGGVIPAEFQAKNNFDRTENLGTVLLGMTMLCARCHTHKYDPITQKEYYEFLAFFNSTAESPLDGNKYTYAPVMKVPANQKDWEQWAKLTEARKAAADGSDVAKKTDAALKKLEAGYTTTLVAKELAKPRETKLLARGEYNLPTGDPLTPNVLSVMGKMPDDAPRNRLGLAQWLTDRKNPLVARVMVNRVWQRVYGEALVRTPEDFGLQGQQPTHPELLDWLSVELQDTGWDLKATLKLMVTSRTYKQSSAFRTDVADPENKLFSRGPRYRLSAEELRDMGLWAAGMLEGHMGGEGVKPYQPPGMWKALAHPASNTKAYVPDSGSKVLRRSLYVYWKRTSPHPMMTLFDAPSREVSCVRRSRSNTPLQSLGLFNEPQRVAMARSFASRLLREAPTDEARVERMFHMIASRAPTAAETATVTNLLGSMKARYAASRDEAIALAKPPEATSASSESQTGISRYTPTDAEAKALKFDGAYSFYVKFTAKGDGTLVAKAPKKGKWAKNGKAFFIQDGVVCFDIGWVGQIQGKRKVNDGKPHQAVLRVDGDTIQIYVDGALDSQGRLKGASDAKHVFKIGACSTSFPPDFHDDIAMVQYLPQALTPERAETMSKSGPGKAKAAFVWSGGSEIQKKPTTPSKNLDPVEHAAWTQVAATLLASDIAIMLY
jgi:hypothetical protein